MNFFRYILWKIALKKICYVISPTQKTSEYIYNLNIIKRDKIFTIYDPIIKYKQIKELLNQKVKFNNYYIAIGRLTKQKIFFIIKSF